MQSNKELLKKLVFIILIIIVCAVMFIYQSKKQGFHEDEVYTITSSVNPYGGLISAYSDKDTQTQMCEKYIFNENIFIEIKNAISFILNNQDYQEEINEIDANARPIWRTKEDIKNNVTLSKDNYMNLKALYYNQLKDTHPPLFYTIVHFTSILFGGQFTKYTIFIINIAAFILSLFIIKKILSLINKENLLIPTVIFYGLSMGTITMVLYQRMYMLLTVFILLYFYYSLKLYKNGFCLNKELKIKLGITTVFGFLTQYYFAIYAFLILLIMIAKMIKDKNYKNIAKIIWWHFIYAVIGILIFIPSLYHLFAERGLSNLKNSNYFEHLGTYVKYLLYAFTIEDNVILVTLLAIAITIGVIYCAKKSNEKFIMALTIIPSIVYFVLIAQLTSFQEFRYIMPIMPFIPITIMIVLDKLINYKYKNILIVVIAILLVTSGFVYSKPKFLFEEYEASIQIAKENEDKPFVYVYDNIFNHMQSIPEMMIYKESIVINYNKNELQYALKSDELKENSSYILCIKTYMDNEKIINEIKENSEYKSITKIYEGPTASSEKISNNLYLVKK